MLKVRDFYLKKVYNTEGKKLGMIEDIYLDFYGNRIVGFEISNYTLLSKKNYLDIENIIYSGESFIVSEIEKNKGLRFRDIKSIDIIDVHGNLKGVVEELIIDSKDYSIKGIVMSSGLIDTMIKGKQILLTSECVLGEDYILYTGNSNISLKSIPHNLGRYNEVSKA